MTRAVILLIVALGALSGCGGGPARVSGVEQITEIRPEVIYYVDELGRATTVAEIWGHGPVNVTALLAGNVGGQPERARTSRTGPLERVDAGSSFLGSFSHTPQPGDSIVCVLLPYAPIVDSLGATSGSAVLSCSLPDTLDLRVVVFIPPGTRYGPDTLKTWARLIRAPS